MSFYKEVPGFKTTLESVLKFDKAPVAGSTNPVTSEGVKGAIDGAVGDASEALQEQIDEIAEKAGSGYTPKGEASVATLNGLSGQENGELYTMTDAGTLTDGSLAVVAGDTVAWDATNSVWYKAMDYAPRQYGTNEVYNLPYTSTINNTDKFLLATSAGGKSIGNVTLQKFFADGTLGDNFAPMFDITKDYKAGDVVVYYGTIYEFIVDHSAGAPDWANEAKHLSAIDYFAKQKDLEDTDKIIETITNGWSEESLTLANGCIKSDGNVLSVSSYQYTQAIYLRVGDKIKAKVAANSTLPISVVSRLNAGGTGYVPLVVSDIAGADFEYKTYTYTATYPTNVYVCGRVTDLSNNPKYTIDVQVYNEEDVLVDHLEYANLQKGFLVDKNGGGDFTSLTQAIYEATMNNRFGYVVRVAPGTYDLIQEFKDRFGATFFDTYTDSNTNKGIVLKNGVKVLFAQGAKVTCHYTGANDSVMKEFSPFNSGAYGFEVDGLVLESSKVRYCVHDERYSETDVYFNRYRNCRMKQDNSASTQTFRGCIGGGFGQNGNIIVENSTFESVGLNEPRGIVTWHNSGNSYAKNIVVVRNCYFKGYGSFYIHYAGASTEMSLAIVCDNYFEKAGPLPVGPESIYSTTENVEMKAWNNYVGTDLDHYTESRDVVVESLLKNAGTSVEKKSVTWSDGFYYNDSYTSTNSRYQMSSDISLMAGQTIIFIGGNMQGSTDNFVQAITRTDGSLTSLVKYANGDAREYVSYRATANCSVSVCSLKEKFGGDIYVINTPPTSGTFVLKSINGTMTWVPE